MQIVDLSRSPPLRWALPLRVSKALAPLLPRRRRRRGMDKSMLGDMDGLPEEDQMRMAAMVEQLQIRDRFVDQTHAPLPDDTS